MQRPPSASYAKGGRIEELCAGCRFFLGDRVEVAESRSRAILSCGSSYWLGEARLKIGRMIVSVSCQLQEKVRMSGRAICGIAVHAIGEEEYCWVYLATGDDSSSYAELPGDDECYPSKDAALIAAYLAFRKSLRTRGRY